MQPQDPHTPDPRDKAVADANTDANADIVRQQRRRMLLRAGAGVVPVTLTLVSRPVRAWHCNTSSAWGSAQVSPNASTTARNAVTDLEDESWTITNWKANSTRAGLPYPWTKAQTIGPTFPTPADAQKGLRISHLFPTAPTGLVATDKIYRLLNDQTNSGGPRTVTDFQKFMIVAKLNATFIPNVAACLQSNGVDQLAGMIDGSYQPTNIQTTGAWSQATIMQYLTDNYIVVP